MSNFNKLWKSLNEDRVNEAFGDPIPKEFKDSINKTVDKLKDISDGISKSIGYLNRMKRDLTGGESINDIEERKAEIVKKLSEFSKLDFESVLGIESTQQNEEVNESVKKDLTKAVKDSLDKWSKEVGVKFGSVTSWGDEDTFCVEVTYEGDPSYGDDIDEYHRVTGVWERDLDKETGLRHIVIGDLGDHLEIYYQN